MDKITDFLNDSSSTNLNVIITAIVATILTTILISFSRKAWLIARNLYSKGSNKAKEVFVSTKDVFSDRKSFRMFYKDYKSKKIQYNFEEELKLMEMNNLSNKQEKIRQKILKENREVVKKDLKRINEIINKYKSE